VPVAVGLGALGARLVERAGLRPRGRGVAVAASLAALAVAAGLSYPALVRAHSPALDRELANLLASLPRDAVVVARSDHLYAGLGYLQVAEGRRPDVVYVDRRMLAYDWYR